MTPYTHTETTQEDIDIQLLRSLGIPIKELILMLINMHHIALTLNRKKSNTTHVLKIINSCFLKGFNIMKETSQNVRFKQCWQESLKAKRLNRRFRTTQEIDIIGRRLIKHCPGLAGKYINEITPTHCMKYITQAFHTPRQQSKARSILSGILSYGISQGWLKENPVHKVDPPVFREKTVPSLTLQEAQTLIARAEEYRNGICSAGFSLMLYAGIRPTELTRLTWADIDLQDSMIRIMPVHSKTGGARAVTIQPVLAHILRRHQQPADTPVVPKNWEKHRRTVIRLAGWGTAERPWIQDVLRHSFASYYSLYFKDYHNLQYEMGHTNQHLLRTRYLNIRGISRADAATFWRGV